MLTSSLSSHCITLQLSTATHCTPHCRTQQHTCNTLTELNSSLQALFGVTALHFNATLQHTATHCSTQQHAAVNCSTLQHTATHCSTLQHSAVSLACAQVAPRSSRKKSHLQSPFSLTHIHTPTHILAYFVFLLTRVCVCVCACVYVMCVCMCAYT